MWDEDEYLNAMPVGDAIREGRAVSMERHLSIVESHRREIEDLKRQLQLGTNPAGHEWGTVTTDRTVPPMTKNQIRKAADRFNKDVINIHTPPPVSSDQTGWNIHVGPNSSPIHEMTREQQREFYALKEKLRNLSTKYDPSDVKP